jgi:hypothetical protein
MCEKAYSDILPRFGVTSCLREHATSCLAPVSLSGCIQASQNTITDWQTERHTCIRFDCLRSRRNSVSVDADS